MAKVALSQGISRDLVDHSDPRDQEIDRTECPLPAWAARYARYGCSSSSLHLEMSLPPRSQFVMH